MFFAVAVTARLMRRVSGVPVTLPVPVTVIPSVVEALDAAAGTEVVTAARATLDRLVPRRYAARIPSAASARKASLRPFSVIVMPL